MPNCLYMTILNEKNQLIQYFFANSIFLRKYINAFILTYNCLQFPQSSIKWPFRASWLFDCQLLLSPLIVMLQCNVYWPQTVRCNFRYTVNHSYIHDVFSNPVIHLTSCNGLLCNDGMWNCWIIPFSCLSVHQILHFRSFSGSVPIMKILQRMRICRYEGYFEGHRKGECKRLCDCCLFAVCCFAADVNIWIDHNFLISQD